MATEPLTDRLQTTLGVFDASGTPLTTSEVAEELDLGRRSTYNRLDGLVERGRLETKKVGASARVWWRPSSVGGRVPDESAVASAVGEAFDGADIGLFLLDEDDEVVWATEAIERYFGVDRDGIVGRDKRTVLRERIAPAVAESAAFVDRLMTTYDENPDTEQFECRVTADDGRAERWLEHRSKPVESGPFADGRVELYYDITDRKDSERSRRQDRNQFESLVEAVEEYAIFVLDADGHVETWNTGAERIKGYESTDILGEHFSTFYTEADREAGVPERNLAAAAADGSTEDEGWRVRADGSQFFANVNITAITDADGDLEGFVKVTRDMTERKRAREEHQLQLSVSQALAAAESLEDGLAAAMEQVCTWTDWDVGLGWEPSDDGVAERLPVSYTEMDAFEEFDRASREFSFEEGEGIPGRVLASEGPVWFGDVSSVSPDIYPRRDLAAEAGLKAGLGVPVVVDGEVAVVLEFYMTESRDEQEWLVEVVGSIAAELGGLVARKQVEDARAKERELLDRVLETAPVRLAILGADGSIERLNTEAERQLGLEGEDPATAELGDFEIYDPEEGRVSAASHSVWNDLVSGEPVSDWLVRHEHASEGEQWLSLSATPLLGDGGDVERVIVAGRDVTDLKRAQQRLQRQRDDLEAELDQVFERIDDGFFALDREWHFTYANDQAGELVGQPPELLEDEYIWDVFSEAVGTVFQERYEHAMETQESVEFEAYYEPLGTWFQIHVYPSATGLSVYFRDVTERKRRERELELYETIVETVDDGIYAVDEDARFVLVNDAMCELTGYDREELFGAHATSVHDDGLTLHDGAPEGRSAAEREAAAVELDIHRPDGTHVSVESRIRSVPLEDGHGQCGIVRDISDRKAFEETLTALYDSAHELFAATDEAEVSEVVVDTVTDVLALDGVTTYLYDEDEDLLVPSARNLEGRFMRDQLPAVPPEDSSITGHVYATGESRRFEDITGSDLLQVEAAETEMRAGIFVPMSDHGVVIVGSREADVFDDRTHRLVELLAANAEAAYDRVERERALAESEQRHRTMVDNFPNGAVALVDEDLRFLTVGGDLYDGIPVSARDLEGESLGDWFPSRVAEQFEPRYRAAFDGERSEFEFEFEGQVRHVRVVPIGDESGDVFAAMAMSQDITERIERERELVLQRERLSALNGLNDTVNEITSAVLEQSSRAEIEATVCEHLAASDSYAFAWVGDVDVTTQTVDLRTGAGVEGYLDDIHISTDADDPHSQGATGQALLTGEMQTTKDVTTDSEYVRWRDEVNSYGFQSSAAVPITHEGTTYGVLNVYSERPRAFEDEERDVIEQLGTVVGHAIAATERKRALMSETVVELDFHVGDLFTSLDVGAPEDGRITLDHTVPVRDGEFLVYGSVTEAALESLDALTDTFPHWESITYRSDTGDREFELRLSEPPVIEVVASLGGIVEEVVLEDGDGRIRIHMPPRADVRRVTQVVQESYPGAELVRREQTSRPAPTVEHVGHLLTTTLSERQRAALEAAYHSGFFEWPRDTTGQEIASSLDIAPATFSQHIRKAERKVFDSLFESEAGSLGA